MLFQLHADPGSMPLPSLGNQLRLHPIHATYRLRRAPFFSFCFRYDGSSDRQNLRLPPRTNNPERLALATSRLF